MGESWKCNGEKPHRSRQRQINRYSKSCLCKQSKTTNSFTTYGQAAVQLLPGQQCSSCVMIIWQDKCCQFKHLPSFSSHLLLLKMMSHGVWHPFGQLGSLVLAVTPPNFLCTPTCSLVAQCVEHRQSRWQACKQCSTAIAALLCYQYYFPHKSKTQHPTSFYE